MNRINFRKIVGVVLSLCLLVSLSSCNSANKQKYYSEKENYIKATGTISYISYNEDLTALYLDFSELNPAFDDTCFKIVGDNLLIVREKGIDDKLIIGDQVAFVTAPKYFGDGYVMPIVAISVNGESLLEFEDGYTNLQNWLGMK